MLELVQQLVSATGVSEGQAEGGAGLIMGLLKEQLASADFSKLAAEVPGVETLLDKAPSNGGEGLSGMLGGVASMLGGGQLANLAGLAEGFSKLGMDSGLIGKFIPVILQFVQDKGGDSLGALVGAALQG